jgi:hypothetical protein
LSLRSRLRRVEKALVGGVDHVELVDGSTYYFTPSDAAEAVFLSEWAIGRAGYRGEKTVKFSELIEAVARATPESRRRFIERYRDPFVGPSIVAAGNARVRLQWCTLEGELRTEMLEGEEARRYVEERRAGGGSGI